MNDKPPSTSGTGSTTLIARIKRALKGDPWSREEIQDFIQQSEVELDAEEKSMLAGVLEVSETQVRDVMVPRSQMVVIDIEKDFDEILGIIRQLGLAPQKAKNLKRLSEMLVLSDLTDLQALAEMHTELEAILAWAGDVLVGRV